MKKLLAVIALGAAFSSIGIAAAAKGPDIRILDDKVSIQADAVPLSTLLRLLGQVTGLEAKVPPELANRNISVRFSNLKFEDAIRKVFEGQPLDYVLVEGKSIVVTGLSQAAPPQGRTAQGAFTPSPQENVFVEDNPPFVPPQMQMQQNMNQPAMIQTPFGPIPNPNVRTQAGGIQQNGIPQGINTMPAQGQFQQNPFNSTLPGLTPNGAQLPTLQTNPFGSPQTAPTQTPSMMIPGVYPTPYQGGQPNNPFPTRPNP